MSSGRIGPRGYQYRYGPLTDALAVGLSLLLTIVIGGVLYLVLYGIPAMVSEGAGIEGNPVPTPVILMVGAMFLVTAGWFLYSVYEFLTTDEDEGEGDDGARLERLKAAYAAGELDEEEFERRLSAIDGGGSRRTSGGGANVHGRGGADSRSDVTGEHLESASRNVTTPERSSGSAHGRHGTTEREMGAETRGSESTADGGGRSTASDPLRPSPEALLRHRFADGELDEAEFTRKLELLRQTESDGETE